MKKLTLSLLATAMVGSAGFSFAAPVIYKWKRELDTCKKFELAVDKKMLQRHYDCEKHHDDLKRCHDANGAHSEYCYKKDQSLRRCTSLWNLERKGIEAEVLKTKEFSDSMFNINERGGCLYYKTVARNEKKHP